MKTLAYITVILFGLMSSSAIGQTRVLQNEDGVIVSDKDTVVIKIDNDEEVKVSKKNKKNKFRVGLLDLGVSSYLHNESLNHDDIPGWQLRYPNSHNWNLHIFRHRVNLLAESLFFEYGVSTNFRRFSFENDVVLLTEGHNSIIPVESEENFKKSKFRTTYLEAPIMITLNPKGKKFTLSVGGYAGMRIGSSQKIKSKEEGKTIARDDFSLRDFTSGGIVRLGFGPVDFYCQVAAESMFNDGIDPELVPITFGISLINF